MKSLNFLKYDILMKLSLLAKILKFLIRNFMHHAYTCFQKKLLNKKLKKLLFLIKEIVICIPYFYFIFACFVSHITQKELEQ